MTVAIFTLHIMLIYKFSVVHVEGSFTPLSMYHIQYEMSTVAVHNTIIEQITVSTGNELDNMEAFIIGFLAIL